MRTKQSLWLKAAAVMVLGIAGLVAVVMVPSYSRGAGGVDLTPEGGELYPQSDFGWLTLYMHHVYECYTNAKASFDKGDMATADANLNVLELYVEASKSHLPDKLQNGKPFDKKTYAENMGKLTAFAEATRGNLKNKKWADTTPGQRDPLMQSCVGCHQSYNIPTDFHVDSKLKVLTQVMHQIYDIYHLAGAQLTGEKWDDAKSCFMVCRAYLEIIPANIPEVNQDGQKIDQKLFTTTYNQLKQFNDDKIRQLETKSFMGGKPLPPPRVVMDNCKACHTNAKIESPW